MSCLGVLNMTMFRMEKCPTQHFLSNRLRPTNDSSRNATRYSIEHCRKLEALMDRIHNSHYNASHTMAFKYLTKTNAF